MYFFDVHVLYECVYYVYVVRRVHTNSESSHRRIKRGENIQEISAFLRRLFRKLKDVFFLKTHV